MTVFLKLVHSSGTNPLIVGVIAGVADGTLSRNGYVFGEADLGDIGPEGGAAGGAKSGIYDRGVAVEGGRPNAATVVGKLVALDGGLEGGLDACLEWEPEPGRNDEVEYGAAAIRASLIVDGAEVISDCTDQMMFGVPTFPMVENWLLSG